MEVRVQLKICEGCGCLWYRASFNEGVYCKACETKLKAFPSPESRKRRGRPCGRKLTRLCAVAEVAGGAV